MKQTGRDRGHKLEWPRKLAGRLLRGRHHQAKELVLRSCATVLGTVSRTSDERYSKEYRVALPYGFGAQEANIRLSVPSLPIGLSYDFSEHITDADGTASDRVIACTVGGLAISDDLGASWRRIKLRGFGRFPIIQSRMLPGGEILLLAADSDNMTRNSEASHHLIVCREDGTILHSAHVKGPRWHGPRSVDLCGSTLMYAEYPDNDTSARRPAVNRVPSRVWRSRDFGRSWECVREERNIRHFHALQANPDVPREWWLTSGDTAEESRIWKSNDDGDTWTDQTDKFGDAVRIGDETYSRRLFRLTDLTWLGDEIIWGSDDVLHYSADSKVSTNMPGSRVFRGNPSTGEAPRILGYCGPEVRNIVDVDDFRIVLTQSTHHLAGLGDPRVLLMTRDGSAFSHLFDVERLRHGRTGFTYSRASRRGKNGVFFTFRGASDVFNATNRVLKWQVTFG